MRIHTMIRMTYDGRVLEDESFEYHGPVAECGASGVIMAISAAVTAASAISQGQYQRKVGKYNAEVSRQKAETARQVGEREVQQHREQVRRLKGSQRVAFLTSGVTMAGSALDVLADTEQKGQLDESIIRWNADMAGRGFDQRAELSLAAGKQAYSQGLLSAGETVLSTAGKWDWSRKTPTKKTPVKATKKYAYTGE